MLFQCSRCSEFKEASYFARCAQLKRGLRSACKPCEKRIFAAAYAADPEKFRAVAREAYWKNREAFITRGRSYQNANRADLNERARLKARTAHSRTLRKANLTKRLITDPTFKLKTAVRDRARSVIRAERVKKSGRTIDLLGCSWSHAERHIQAKFKPGMSWQNYGKWHIDHERPCASFDMRDPEQQRACFHFSNLQPLWASENISKGAKFKLA